jgi:hypothetical protein
MLVSLFACANSGSNFVGKWVQISNPSNQLEIVRNGDQFLIVVGSKKIGLVYKDGVLDAGYLRVIYVKSSDTITIKGSEYKRIR